MHIGVDASQANAAVRTGTERYAFEILHALARIRHDETYTLYIETPLRNDMQDLGPGFTARQLHWPARRLWHQGRLSVEMLLRAPDVFFAPAHALPLVHPGRSVTMIHDVGFEDYPELYPRAERMYHAFAARHALRTAAKILVPSSFTKERILAHFSVAPDKIVVIPHGFRPDRATRPTPEEHAAVLQRLQLPPRPYFLYVGRIEQKKNVANLVRAFALAQKTALQDHMLLLAGKEGFGADEVRRVITDQHLEQHVRLLGYTSWEDVAVLRSGAMQFAFLSNYEGFGFPLLEAFADGVPVLTANAGSLPEVAGDAACIVAGDDVHIIADAMIHLQQDAGYRQELIAKGKERVQRFSWEAAARMTRDILFSV